MSLSSQGQLPDLQGQSVPCGRQARGTALLYLGVLGGGGCLSFLLLHNEWPPL